MKSDSEYCQEQLVGLVGGTVSSVINDGEEFFGLMVDVKKGKEVKKFTVWVTRDAEWNGPGWVTVEEYVEGGEAR